MLTKKKTRIISAFPGIGKSYYHKLFPETTLDSDSSLFSWEEGKQGIKRNPDFPNNYVTHIKENIGKYDFIFVSSHKEVREALLKNCLFFYLIYPSKDLKDVFIERYKDRGSSEDFISLVSKNYESWIKELTFCEYGCLREVVCKHNINYGFDGIISRLLARENGDSL